MEKITIRTKYIVYLLLFINIFIVSITHVEANEQKIIPISSDYYSTLEQIAATQGISVSNTIPFSSDEFLMVLQKIDSSLLDDVSYMRYTSLIDSLSFYTDSSKNSIVGSFHLDIALEGYFHTNVEEFIHEGDWVFDNEKRKPMISLEIDSHIFTSVYFYTNFIVKKNRFSRPDETEAPSPRTPVDTLVFSPPFSSNIVMPPNHDFDVPSRAFIAAGGKGYSVQFGRDKLSWGPGSSSNFIIGDHHKYQDFLRFTFYNKKVKFTNVILFMHPPGYTTRFRHPYVPSSASDHTVRMFLAHRLEFNINSWLQLEISENVMYQDTTFNLKYLNPLYIYHNYGNRSLFNAIADISLEASIARGVNVYASIAFDQLTAPTESSDQPPALAYMLGAKYYYPTKTGWWNFLVEGVYIDPYMYMRDKVDFIIMTREREQYYGAVPHYEYLGYKDGGDLIVATIKGEYHANQEFSMSSSFTYKAKGSVDIETPYVFGRMPNLLAPTSPVTTWLITDVTAKYVKDDDSLLIFNHFEIFAEVDLIIKKEGNNSPLIDAQCIVGLTLGL